MAQGVARCTEEQQRVIQEFQQHGLVVVRGQVKVQNMRDSRNKLVLDVVDAPSIDASSPELGCVHRSQQRSREQVGVQGHAADARKLSPETSCHLVYNNTSQATSVLRHLVLTNTVLDFHIDSLGTSDCAQRWSLVVPFLSVRGGGVHSGAQ